MESMLGSSAASRRIRRGQKLLIALQVLLLLFTMIAPVGTIAADPSPSASDSAAAPSSDPSADPSAQPSATPDPTPAATPDPTPAPTDAPTPAPTDTWAPTPTDTPTPAPTDAPTTAPTDTPTPAPTDTPTATADPSDTPTPAYVPMGAPTIASDKNDYAPGELVTLTGSNWYAGETVSIGVNDDAGSTWSRNSTATADASGHVSDSFNLPNWFVANYSVAASGSRSGLATTSFTDGNVNVKTAGVASSSVTWARFSNTSCQAGAGQPIASGTITATSSGNGTAIAGGASSSESLRLTAGAVGGSAFSA
ncbi:MAG TPA: hypothetical protein VFP22_11545, partial [Candidatus Limnocylindrales bacterium]|nr:hypothetical protein [Candidatus Limnocylindrales bacterium]